MISFFKSIKNKSYIFSRFISVSIKPLMLFVSLALGYKEFGTVIAMVFLVSSVNMMLCSVPIFREFFINFDNKSTLKKKYFKNKYKSQIVTLFLISIILIIPINQFFENSIEIFICSLLIFSVDKIYDEIQRVLILKKDFNAWSTITNFKNIILIIFLLNPIININIMYLGVTYFLINFFKYYAYINLSFNLKIKKEIKRFSFSIWKNKKIYIMNYFLLFYTIGDKVVIGKNFKEDLTEYIFLSYILSVPLLFILFFYISKYRAEFVNNLISFKDVIFSKKFNYLLISTFFLASVIVLFYYNLSFSKFSLASIILLLLIHFIKAYSLILDEIVYWKSYYKDFLFFEFLFFILFAIVILLTSYLDLTLDIFLPMLLILFFVKFIFKMIIFINKS
jgi:hypothetical protein